MIHEIKQTGTNHVIARQSGDTRVWPGSISPWPIAALRDIADGIRFRLAYRAYWAGRYPRADRLFRPLAKRGDCAAQYYLGRMSARGEGTGQDVEQAICWWNASAGGGERWAQVEIGNLYETGRGVPRDYTKAMRWYQRAADAGLAEAQVRVGFFYDKGLGTRCSHSLARQWYIRAAVQGERNAYHNLAIHYARGLGIPADRQKALAWLRKAMPHQHDNVAVDSALSRRNA